MVNFPVISRILAHLMLLVPFPPLLTVFYRLGIIGGVLQVADLLSGRVQPLFELIQRAVEIIPTSETSFQSSSSNPDTKTGNSPTEHNQLRGVASLIMAASIRGNLGQ